jgi:paraquat-inducible protein B
MTRRGIMGKEANKTLIGVFVVGAITLIVAAILILGGGKFFRKTYKVVMFFEGSIKGLNIGSPLMFHGVKIGSVTDINLILNAKDLSLQTPVIVELDPQRWTLVGGERGDVRRIKALIDRGLRAQLQTQSFVTGQLLIALDFFPDKPARYVGLVKEYPEMPTVPSSLEELSKTLQELPLKEIVTKLELAIDGIQKLVNAPETRASIESLNSTLKSTQKLVQHVDEQIKPLMSSLTKTSDAAHETLSEAKNTISVFRDDAKETLADVRDTLKQAEKTLATFSDDSRLVYEMNKTLKSLSEATRSLRLLSDYLERHPEALLKGKNRNKGD